MSQCVPSSDLDDNPAPATARHSLRSNSNSTAPDVTVLDYEVAELTWENGQIAMHGLGPPRVVVKPMTYTSTSKCTWDKQPRASGTLESIVNQATCLPTPCCKAATTSDCVVNNDELVPWFNHHPTTSASASTATMTKDALVPCSNWSEDRTTRVTKSVPALVGCSTRVASCSGPAAPTQEDVVVRRAREAPVPMAGEWSSRDQSVSASATFGSQQMTLDTYEKDLGRDFTSTSLGSPENTSSEKPGTKTTTGDDHDSVCHSRPQKGETDEEDKKKGSGKSSVSTKRSRAAAIHNQSERKRRDKINQKMKTLQKLVPNANKTDKASMLDEVIEYLKQLQAQVQMMSRMNIPAAMMLPISMQQQLQMSMMAPMGIGMGMGMGLGVMDINTLSRPSIAGISPVMPANPFMPMTSSWDNSASDRLQPSLATVMPDPLSAFLACQSQPMTLDAYNRMAAIYQQMQQQPPASNSKS